MAIIDVDGLTKRYGDTVAADDVSFSVDDGEIFGVLGPNGAGKTTIVECVEGLRAPDAGTIRVSDLDPRRDRAALRQVLGAQLQQTRLPDKLRVREALALYRSFYPDSVAPDELLGELGLAGQRNAFFEDLSGGQQQRLSVALALVGRPRVAILDELTTGLDPHARRDAWRLVEQIRDTGVTVVLVTHFMEEAERLCDRIAIVDGGRLVAVDTAAGLIARAGLGQQVRLRAHAPFDDTPLRGHPQVTAVSRDGDDLVVTGTGDLLTVVAAALVTAGVVPTHLAVRQATLDDAFLALTGRRTNATSDSAQPATEAS